MLAQTPALALVLAASLACQDPGVESPGGQGPPDEPGTQESDPPDSGDPQTSDDSYDPLRGFVELMYQGRWANNYGGSNYSDNNLRLYSVFDLGDARSDLVTGHVAFTSYWDIDNPTDPANPFYSVWQTYDSALTGWLYEAYADLNAVEDNPVGDVFKRIRLGRQILYDVPTVLFVDGVSFETQPLTDFADMTVSGFGGIPNYMFVSSRSGDWTAGASVRFTPWRYSQFRVDYMHVTDKFQSVTSNDDLWGARFYQRFSRNWFLDTHANMINGRGRDVGLNATWTNDEGDLSFAARYNGLLSDQGRQSIQFDQFTTVMGNYFAYDQGEVFGHKSFEDVYLDAGLQGRRLRDRSVESMFNHEFLRYYGTLGVDQWPWKGLDASVTGELWDSGGDDFASAGLDVTQEFSPDWRGSVGTFFQLYRYDLITDQERGDVQVYYARARHQASDALSLRGEFEYEDTDVGDFYVLRLTAKWDF